MVSSILLPDRKSLQEYHFGIKRYNLTNKWYISWPQRSTAFAIPCSMRRFDWSRRLQSGRVLSNPTLRRKFYTKVKYWKLYKIKKRFGNIDQQTNLLKSFTSKTFCNVNVKAWLDSSSQINFEGKREGWWNCWSKTNMNPPVKT